MRSGTWCSANDRVKKAVPFNWSYSRVLSTCSEMKYSGPGLQQRTNCLFEVPWAATSLMFCCFIVQVDIINWDDSRRKKPAQRQLQHSLSTLAC